LVAACSDSGTPTAPVGALQSELVTCQAAVRTATLTCAASQPQPAAQLHAAPGMSFDRILGGQGALVRLASSGTSYNSVTQSFTSSVTVENLLAQAMNTADGTTPDAGGIKVFFHSGPTVTGGTGTITVVNFDGTGTFTGADQKYFLYSTGAVLPSGESTSPKQWQFSVPTTVTTFAFQVFVTTRLPNETSALVALGLSRSPSALTILPGATGTTTVDLTRTNFTGAVTLSLSDAPTGVTGAFNPAAPTGNSSTLTVSVGAAVALGTYFLTVDGTGGAGHRSTPLTLTVGALGGAAFGHVFIVVEENNDYANVIGSAAMPYLNSLAQQYGLATQYYANTHPSIGNYFMMTVGDTVTNDDSYTGTVSEDNVVRQLLQAGKTWKSYAEDLPYVGYHTPGETGDYASRHNPFSYLTDVVNDPAQLNNLVPFTQFPTDLANGALPSYSFIVPNLCDDAHDCSLSTADSWLQANIDPLIKSATFQQDGLLIILFDESEGDHTNGGGRIAWVVVSPKAKGGYQSSTFYQHQSTLRLSLQALGVTAFPNGAASAPDMDEFFSP
jgi:hypothetical protein